MKVIFTFFFGLLILASCSEEYGHEIHGGNLTVFFLDEEDQAMAEKIALFWKENELITGNNQDIQLIKEGDWYEIRVIAKRPEEVKAMNFDERKKMLDLQQNIQLTLNEPNLQLIICNERFEEIYNINE